MVILGNIRSATFNICNFNPFQSQLKDNLKQISKHYETYC